MRKDFKELLWDVDEPTYRADSAISYSTLSTFAKGGFKALKESLDGIKISSASLKHGSLVDTLLTDKENFNNLYTVADYKVPSETILKIVEDIWEISKEAEDYSLLTDVAIANQDMVMSVINNNNYGGANWKEETKIKKVVEEGESYYNLLAATKGVKELVSEEEYNLANGCVLSILTHPYTSWLFKKTNDSEIHYQSKFKISFNGLLSDVSIYKWKDEILETNTIRCMFDMIYINHTEKVILPIDLKTTYLPEEQFYESFIKWRYDLQSTMYSYILRNVVKNDVFYKDYKILPFRFLPINKFSLNPQFFRHKESIDDIQKVFKDPNGIRSNDRLPWYNYLELVRGHIKEGSFRYNLYTIKNNGLNDL